MTRTNGRIQPGQDPQSPRAMLKGPGPGSSRHRCRKYDRARYHSPPFRHRRYGKPRCVYSYCFSSSLICPQVAYSIPRLLGPCLNSVVPTAPHSFDSPTTPVSIATGFALPSSLVLLLPSVTCNVHVTTSKAVFLGNLLALICEPLGPLLALLGSDVLFLPSPLFMTPSRFFPLSVPLSIFFRSNPVRCHQLLHALFAYIMTLLCNLPPLVFHPFYTFIPRTSRYRGHFFYPVPF